MERMHHEVELMTRRLELEKRRLQRVDKELVTARKTRESKLIANQRSERSQESLEFSRTNSSGQQANIGRPSSRGGPQSARGRMPGGNAASLQLVELASLPLKTVSARLQQQLLKLNIVKQNNRELKEQVNSIRKQRLQLNRMFEKLKLEIKQRTDQLLDFVEDTDASVQMQSDAAQRLAVMKKQRETERAHFKKTVFRIRTDLRSCEFQKKEIENQLKRAETGVQKKKVLIVPDEEHEFSENAMIRRIMKTAFLNCIQRRHIKQHQKAIEVFEQAFATIKQSTGISSIEEIVKIFVNLESRNYSLLTYVNHINREIELVEGLARRRIELRSQEAEAAGRYGENKHEALKDVNKELQATELSIDESREACRRNRALLKSLQPVLMQISQRILAEQNQLREAQAEPGHKVHELANLRQPEELREDTIPAWLDWVMQVLGHFGDIVTHQEYGSSSFSLRVKQMLTPKKNLLSLGAMVRPQDLPSFSTQLDDNGNKRSPNLNAQKADANDEESDEEDFGDRPLMFKDIRSRVEAALQKKKSRRQRRINHAPPVDAADSLAKFAAANTQPGGLRISSALRETATPGSDLDEVDEASSTSPSDAQQPEESSADMARIRSARAVKLAACAADIGEDDLVAAFSTDVARVAAQAIADRIAIHIGHICFLKRKFDTHDKENGGYISIQNLPGLLVEVGQEDLHGDELDQVLKQIPTERDGKVGFFELAEWFVSDAESRREGPV